jgi:hypothetical protein
MSDLERQEVLDSSLWEPHDKSLGYIEAGDYYDAGMATLKALVLIIWPCFIFRLSDCIRKSDSVTILQE